MNFYKGIVFYWHTLYLHFETDGVEVIPWVEVYTMSVGSQACSSVLFTVLCCLQLCYISGIEMLWYSKFKPQLNHCQSVSSILRGGDLTHLKMFSNFLECVHK